MKVTINTGEKVDRMRYGDLLTGDVFIFVGTDEPGSIADIDIYEVNIKTEYGYFMPLKDARHASVRDRYEVIKLDAELVIRGYLKE